VVEHRLPMSDPPDELVDVVDAQDRVLAVVTRREMREKGLRHRAVYLLVVSSAGALLVHRRSDAKDVMPGWWDTVAGGVVGAGESYDEAAERELAEELGISAPLEPLGSATYEDARAAVNGRIYRVRHDGPFRFADGEITEAHWVAPAELPGLLQTRQWCPDSIAIALPLLDTGDGARGAN
jgi:8-oxo-dGTP pyrophosphatase MutT (NUDIX family)